MNISNCYYDEDAPHWAEIDPLFSPAAAIAVPITIVPLFTLQPEVMISSTGWRFKSSITSEDYSSDIEGSVKFTYLDFPLLFVFNIPTRSNEKPHLYCGTSTSFLLRVRESSEGVQDGIAVDTSYYEEPVFENGEEVGTQGLKENYNSAAFSLVFGGGLNVELKKGRILTDIRYTLGLTDVQPDLKSTKMRNRGVTLFVGYGFDF